MKVDVKILWIWFRDCQNSNKEVIFIKSDDQAKVVDERMVFISYSKLPFSISSTIPYNKHSKVSGRYCNSVEERNFCLVFIATPWSGQARAECVDSYD